MDFAPEPVLDTFTPPPTRAAPRAPATDDNGRTFDDHLDATREPPERSTPVQTEANQEAAPLEVDDADASDDTLDPDIALLGGPLPPAPPPMAAPVIVQIAASQPAQQDARPHDAELAPLSAPQAPPPEEPALDANAAQPVEQNAPDTGKSAQPETANAAEPLQAQVTPQAQTAQTLVPQTPIAQTAPIAVEELPQALQQAIASTIAPSPQATVQPAAAQRVGKDAKQQVEAKTTSGTGDAKAEAPVNANVKALAPKVAHDGALKADAAPAFQAQSSAPDTSQLAQTNALTAATSQASSHVQHAAVDAGALRAAPVAAQVGREIVRRFSGGNTNFELRLDPADLGRVEVRMEVTRDNRVTAVITADNPQALTELARNARELEQQLQSAGLQLSDNGLSFDLRQGAQGDNSDQKSASARGESNAAAPEQQAAPLARPIGIDRWRGVRVDLMV